jgi:hypothetical protein
MTTSYETQPWVKLLSSIVTSSIWAEDPATKVVWITLLALMDARTGYVGGSVPGLAQVAGVTVTEAQGAIDKFLAPDPHSRDLMVNPEGEGRRIVRADGGWIVLNAVKIRNMRQAEVRREQNREAQRRRRAAVSKCQQKPADGAPLADMCAMSAHTDTDTDTDTEVEREPEQKQKQKGRVARPDVVPEGLWQDFLKLRAAKKAPLTETALRRIQAEATEAKWPIERVIAECCTRGWASFKASWVEREKPATSFADVDYRQGGEWNRAL